MTKSPRTFHEPSLGKLTKSIAAIFGLAVAGIGSHPLHAQTYWTGGTSQDFNDSTNWSNGFPNVTYEQAFIDSGATNYPIYTAADGTTSTAWDMIVGDTTGAGRLDVTGGTLETTQNGNFLVIGEGGAGGPTGTLNLTGAGSIQTMRLNVGGSEYYNAGTGTATINTTGTLTAQGTYQDIGIDIGVGTGSVGTVYLTNGTVTTGGLTFVGDIGTGTLTQSGGSLSSSDSIDVGVNGGTGYYNLNGGSVSTSGQLIVGSLNGTVVQTSGTLSSAGYFVLGAANGGTGSYTLSSGVVNAATNFGFTTIGSSGGSTGILNVSGGTFNTTAGGMIIGEDYNNAGATSATLTISGSGTVNLGTNGVYMAADQSAITATLNLNGGALDAAWISQGAGAATVNFNGGTFVATTSTSGFMQGLTAAYVLGGGAIINNSGYDVTIAQALQSGAANDGGLTSNGSGSLTLVGDNTYNGPTAINAGTLYIGGPSNSALGTGTVALNSGGTLSSTNDGGANYDPTLTNAVTANGGNIAAGAGTALHVNGNIGGSGALGLTGIFNGSALTLGGDNSGYSGTATVSGPNVRLDSVNAGSANASWVVNGSLQTDVAGGGTFQFGALSENGVIDGHADNGTTAVSTVSVGALNLSSTFSGTIIDQALNDSVTGNSDTAANNQLALTKVGTGSLTLSGNSTYSGPTAVNLGSLLLTGTLGGGTSTTVASGATFDLVSGGAYQFNIGLNGVNNSITNSGGTLTLDGAFDLNLTSADATLGDVWDIVNGAASYTANFTVPGFTDNNGVWTDPIANSSNDYQYSQANGQLTVVSTVPEPGTYASLLLGCATLLGFRRTRRH